MKRNAKFSASLTEERYMVPGKIVDFSTILENADF